MPKALITPPAAEPVSLDEAKAHLRQDLPDDDAMIASLIIAAREIVEQETSRALITQTWELTLGAFPSFIRVPLPPLQQVESITYIDTDGNLQTLDSSDYAVDVVHSPGRIYPAFGVDWPDTRAVPNAVTVRFVAGYGAVADVPQTIKQAMLLLIGEMYENTEETGPAALMQLPLTAERLLWRYKVME